jgi:hypothetical protein
MAATIHTLAHHLKNIEHIVTGFLFAAPGKLILHHHFRYFEPGFYAPVQQIAGGINREGQVHFIFLLSFGAFFHHKTTAYRVERGRYSRFVTQKRLERYRVGVVRQAFGKQKQQVIISKKADLFFAP